MKLKFSNDFLRLLNSINNVRERIIRLPLCADVTEEALFAEVCSYFVEYKLSLEENLARIKDVSKN